MAGFIFVDKPQGLSSFDVVRSVRRACSTRRCGHTGTLDPLATGVLVVAVQGATRFIPFVNCHDKKYIVTFQLGFETNTYDIEGEVTNTSNLSVSKLQLEEALLSFEGEILQVPPMFSAIKQNGKKLYELARKGEEVERNPRPVTIYSAKLLSFNEEKREAKAEIFCSAGTYIRSLVFDLGRKLSCFATMVELRRTEANGVDISKCVSLEDLQNGNFSIWPTQSLLNYQTVVLSQKDAQRFCQGQTIKLFEPFCDGLCCVKTQNGEFCGVGEVSFKNILKAKRVFSG